MDEILNKVAAIYYPVYLLVGFSLNILLYYLIFTKTTPVFKTMRYFLIPSNTSTMILTFVAFFIQVRTVSNTKSLAIMGQGFCKYFGAEVCFHTYTMLLAMGLIVGLLNLHTIFYRMICVKNRERPRIIRKTMMFCIHYWVPIIAIILSEYPNRDNLAVYNETLTDHPDYHLEPFGQFGGYTNSHSFYQTFNTILLAGICIYAPIFGVYCRRNALKHLDSNKTSLSTKSLLQVKIFIHGLTLQVILPLVCYVPVSVTFVYNKYSGEEQLVASQYFIGALTTLTSIFDPMITMYFIVPYRNAVRKIIGKSKTSTSVISENDIQPIEMFQISAVTQRSNRKFLPCF